MVAPFIFLPCGAAVYKILYTVYNFGYYKKEAWPITMTRRAIAI